MTWVALLLVGCGVTDLVFSWVRHPVVAEVAGAVAVVLLGLTAGLTDARDLVAVLLLAAAAVAWQYAVTWGFARERHAVPLAVGAAALLLVVVLGGAAGTGDGLLGRWLETGPLPVLDGLTPDRALLLLGVLLVQLSTGNVIVRLVLGATGTVNPMRRGEAPVELKGGRLLGPMERLFIVGLGLAGQVTAAGIVVAAKGLLRFNELHDARERGRHHEGNDVHQVTEYFLVGSFVSWLVALAGLVVLVGA